MSNPSPEAGAAPKKKLPLILMIVAGVAVGGGVGSFVVAPLLADSPGAAAGREDHAAEESEDGAYEDEEAGEGDHGGGGRPGGPVAIHTLENVVLNPAGTGGTRFLMATIAFAVRDPTVIETMKARDAEIRDAVLDVLGAKTVDQLADIVGRDAMKEEVREALAPLFGKRAVRDVYFPQFVIQ